MTECNSIHLVGSSVLGTQVNTRGSTPAESNSSDLCARLQLLDLSYSLLDVLPSSFTWVVLANESWDVDFLALKHTLLDQVFAIKVVWQVHGGTSALGILVSQDLVVV